MDRPDVGSNGILGHFHGRRGDRFESRKSGERVGDQAEGDADDEDGRVPEDRLPPVANGAPTPGKQLLLNT